MKNNNYPMFIFLSAVLFAASCNSPSTANHQTHDSHLMKVNEQGDKVMGFSHEKTTHHFRLFADGGAIEVTANDAQDTKSRNQIRQHLAHIVTRQDKAVTYVEKIAAGWHKLMPSAVGDGFSLKGAEKGVLTCDFNLLGSGAIVNNPAVTYPPTATPTVQNLTNLYKFYNTQMNITPNDGGSYNTAYGCRYRSFQVDFKKTMLSEAGFQPGCARFLVPNNPNSGMIRSALEFDKQMLEFNFQVDMAAGTPEFEAVQDQRPIAVVIEAIGGNIEGAIPFSLKTTINISKYRTSKPTLGSNIWQFGISGKALFDVTNNQLFQIELVNDVSNYASAF